MQTEHLKNGNLVVLNGSNRLFVIVAIAAFLFFAKDAWLWLFTEDVSGDRWLGVSIFSLVVLFFVRVWSLSSLFEFDSLGRFISYSVQYPLKNEKGNVSLDDVKKAILETDSEGQTRIVLKCVEADIPFTASVQAIGNQSSMCDEINRWIEKNA